MVFACVALLVLRSQIPEQIEGIPIRELLQDYAPLLLSFFVIMSSSSCSSISLEGHNLWILKSLPVSAHTIFLSKIAVNLTYLIPGIFVSSLLLSFAFQANLLQTILCFLVPTSFSFFIACFGLLINLLFPNFTWKSEVTVIKQSVSVLITMLGGMLLVILATVLLWNLPQWNHMVLMGLITVLVFAVSTLIWFLLNRKGKTWFYRLLYNG